MEDDDVTYDFPALDHSTSLDYTPFFGRVAYAYGLGVDQPLSVTRMGYVDEKYNTQRTQFEPFTVLPLWNLRGQPDDGVPFYADGRAVPRCSGNQVSSTPCIRLDWPAQWQAYKVPGRVRNYWHGSLLEDKQDLSGTYYRRNRYYDPATGRFTQEDPIGLAGGLNVYGFANGDPVSYSDPYGLCPGIPGTDQWNLLDCPRGWITAGLTTFGGGAGGIGGGITGGLAGGAACSWSGPGALVCAGGGAAAGAKSGAATGAAAGFLVRTAVEFGIALANRRDGEGGGAEDDNRQFKP